MKNSTMKNYKKYGIRMCTIRHCVIVWVLMEIPEKNADRIYNFKTGSVKTKCLHEGWQTSGSLKVVRMAFNLYCNSTPSVWDYEDAEEQVNECRQYTVEDIFCCVYAPYFWQAIQIRYPEYVVYNQKLHAMLGGID